MYEEVLLSDLYWIYLITFLGIVSFVTLWGQIRIWLKYDDENKLKYFYSTVITCFVFFLILTNYHRVLILLGIRQYTDVSDLKPMNYTNTIK